MRQRCHLAKGLTLYWPMGYNVCMNEGHLQKEIAAVLNRHGVDPRLNLPDWVLAQVVMRLLDSLREAREIEGREWAKSPQEVAK